MGARLAEVTDLAAAHRLEVLGGFPAQDDPALPKGTRTVLMLGLAEPGFWAHFTSQPEWGDGAAHPMDRWSRRVIGRMACDLGARALFPFGGPPWHPFYQWALRTGAVWESPVRLLVHHRQGLLVSFRGALALKEEMELPSPPPSPCTDCAAPCTQSCPAGALDQRGYDVPRCHAHLDEPQGMECMTGGCLVRRACPVSQTYARLPLHSAYHMRQFHT